MLMVKVFHSLESWTLVLVFRKNGASNRLEDISINSGNIILLSYSRVVQRKQIVVDGEGVPVVRVLDSRTGVPKGCAINRLEDINIYSGNIVLLSYSRVAMRRHTNVDGEGVPVVKVMNSDTIVPKGMQYRTS